MNLKDLDDAITAARRIQYAPRELVRLAEIIRDGFVELEKRLDEHQKSTGDGFKALRVRCTELERRQRGAGEVM